MKHIFILQGKKYISSKRASKVSGYAGDYIGQLCRSGKLDAKMVGHTWFVNEEAFLAHCVRTGKITAASAAILAQASERNSNKKASVSRKAVSRASSYDEDADASPEAPARISAKEAGLKFGYTSDYVGQLCRTGKLDARMIGHTWFVTEASLALYRESSSVGEAVKAAEEADSAEISDVPIVEAPVAVDSPKNSNHAFSYSAEEYVSLPLIKKPQAVSPALAAKVEATAIDLDLAPIPSTFFSKSFSKMLIITAFILVASLSVVALRTTLPPSAAPVANAHDAFQSIGSFIGKLFTDVGYEIALMFGHGRPLTTAQAPAVPEAEASGKSEGLVVVPSLGSSAADARLKQDIQSAFSDQVDVVPDQSGTAGVITPVFRQAKGSEYIYMMVPLNHGGSP